MILTVFPWQVGLIWNLVNATCGDIQRALLTRDSSLHKKKSGLRRQDIKLSLILQFAARGRELKRMQRIGKEFEEFVIVSKKKRCVKDLLVTLPVAMCLLCVVL